MKRKLFILTLILALFLTGCSSLERPVVAPLPEDIPEVSEQPPLRSPVYEYGTPAVLVDNGEQLHGYLLYPKTGHEAIDQAIRDWANGVYADAQKELEALREEDAKVAGEMNVQYDAYLVKDANEKDAYVGVEEIGFYDHTLMAHPVDFVKTFNLDLNSQTLLGKEAIIDAQKEREVVELLRAKALALYPDEADSAARIDEQCLENLVLNHDGIDVLLESGRYLPSYLGLQRLSLSYEELGDAFILLQSPSSPEEALPLPEEEPSSPEETPAPPLVLTPPSGEIDGSRPMVALTFDDGPSRFTSRILGLLDQYGGKATFCMVGNLVESQADTVRQVVEQGSEIIGHSWDHKQLTELSADEVKQELENTKRVIYEVAGVRPSLYRPPYGAVNAQIKEVSRELGLAMINWSVDTEDWRSRDAGAVYQAVMADVKDGSIILCHDLYGSTAEAMERVIPELIARGYQLVTVSELLSFSENPVEAGSVYYHR
jgi:peptidoglycan/xylan/chitin deacetylase (PgdA/CDA1 family)